jgi:hypothetical protein
MVLLLASLALGCGERGSAPPLTGSPDSQSDAVKLSAVLDDLREAKDRPAQLPKMFAKGVTPPAAKQLQRYDIRQNGSPSISGDTATLSILFAQEDDPSKTAGQKTWSFVKEGNAWKIKDAPLP